MSKCKKWKITGYIECIIKSDYENLYQAITDWIDIEDDDEYITDFKLIDYDWEEIKE